MKRVVLGIILLLSASHPVFAADGERVYAFEQITAGATAVSLTASKYTCLVDDPSDIPTRRVVIYVETAAVRYRLDGTAPTTSVGEILADGDRLVIDHCAELANAQFIADTGTSATLNVTYRR